MNRFFGSLLLIFSCTCVAWAQRESLTFKHITSNEGLSQNHGNCIIQDYKGFLWFGTQAGLNRYDGYKMVVHKYQMNDLTSISNNTINVLYEDRDKNLWVGTAEGLNKYDRKLDKFIRYLHDPNDPLSISNNDINSIREDQTGKLWIGTASGLNRFDEASGIFKKIPIDGNENIHDNFPVSALYIDQDQQLWVGTGLGGINILQKDGTFQKIKTSGFNSTTYITAICEDKNGVVWIGSWGNGLYQYNGITHTIHKYTKTNHNVIHQKEVIMSLHLDRQGRLWVGTENNGLFQYEHDTNNFINYTADPEDPNSLSNNTVSSIYDDPGGTLWVGVHRGGINYYNPSFSIFTTYRKEKVKNSLSNNNVKAFCEDSDGNIWIGTDGGGLNYYDHKTKRFTTFNHIPGNPSSLSNDVVLCLLEDRTGNIWTGTYRGGLSMLNPSTGKFINYLHDPFDASTIISNTIWSIVEDHDGNIWAGSFSNGLNVLNRKTGVFTRYTEASKNGLTDDGIIVLYKDVSENIWVGTRKGGLCLYDPVKNRFTCFTNSPLDEKSISDNYVTAIAGNKDGKLWVGTSYGLNLFDPERKIFSRISEKDGLPNEAIRGLTIDDAGLVWTSTVEGLSSYDPVKKKFRKFYRADGLQDNEFTQNAFLKARTGEMYFGGINGFNVFHPDSIHENHFVPPVYLTDFFVFNKSVVPDAETSSLKFKIDEAPEIKLSYDESVISFTFAALNYIIPEKNQYAWKMEGFDKDWNYMESNRMATYTNLDPGEYTFKVKASNNDGLWNEQGTSIKVIITPPFWETWWFRTVAIALLAACIVLIFYIRVSAIRKQKYLLKSAVKIRTLALTEANAFLMERNEKIEHQKENLEALNNENYRITDKLLSQQEIMAVQNEQLERTVEQLALINKTKDRFFSILAHDLKSPILAINGLSESLQNNLTHLGSDLIREYVGNIVKSSSSVYSLLNNLLEWARTQSNQLEYKPEAVDLFDLLKKNEMLFEQQLSKKQIKWINLISPGQQAYVDKNMIDTVLRNLLSNAIKFTQKDGVISIRTEQADGQQKIIISDTGIGMCAEQVKTLFAIDKQFYSLGTEGERGSGLGLIISNEFVHLNKGKINVESIQGQGTSFILSLPVQSEVKMPEHVQDVTPTDLSDRLLKLKGKRVLIVEDNNELRTHLRLMLSGIFEIFECGDGGEALKLAQQSQPDIIITDMVMPVMNGLEFCRMLKRNQTTSHIPVILMTGHNNEETQLSGYASGADAYLAKPFKRDILFELIYNFISNRERIRKKILESAEIIPSDLDLTATDKELLSRIVTYINDNLQSDLDPQKICIAVGVSRSVLYLKFKAITGQGIQEFIKSVRLKRSLQLLLEGRMSANQVAYEVGFNSGTYFNSCFKNEFGDSPKEYVRKLREKAG
jgi:ligand-binding sensor domain-containing protein/signal transduction histidine kinase/DNA-binding NarL/FixJ family response regulator